MYVYEYNLCIHTHLQGSYAQNMVGTSIEGLLGLVTLFFNSSVINNLDNYQPEYLPASYYFFYNLSDPGAVPRSVEEDDIYNESTFFPRCCQPGTVYDADNRGCIPVESAVSIHDELNITVNLIQSGLVDCKVIVDRFVKKNNLKLRDGNATLQIENEIYTSGSFCVDNILQDETVYVVRYCENDNYCVNVSQNVGNEWCVHKCCAEGFQLENYHCVLNDRMGIHVKNNSYIFKRTDGYAMMYGTNLNCERTNWKDFQEVDISIAADGNLFFSGSSTKYLINDYCLGTNYDTTTGTIADVIVSCEFREVLYVKWVLIKIAVIITCICFVLTLAVYIFVYRLRKLVEKIIACFCTVDLVFWLMYTIRIFDVRFGRFCVPFAYIYFFITVSRLSWLNVLSFEIWRTVGSPRASVSQTKESLRKHMIYYTVYAILVPIISKLFFIFGSQEMYPLPDRFKPLVNKATCFMDVRGIRGNLGHLHLYIPVSILIIINMVLFVKTILYFLKTKRDLKKISDSSATKRANMKKANKKGFIILKLALVMGLTWIYYLYAYVSSFKNNETVENIGDIISFANIFEGVYFFVIFVVKWKTVKMILQRIKVLNSNVSTSESSTSTMNTKVSTASGLSMQNIDQSS